VVEQIDDKLIDSWFNRIIRSGYDNIVN